MYAVCTHLNRLFEAILMSTHNIHLKYRTPKRYPTIISTVSPGVALIVTFRDSNYRCLEQIFMVPKGFEPSKFDCNKVALTQNIMLLHHMGCSERKEVASSGSKFVSLRVAPVLETILGIVFKIFPGCA